MRLPPRDYLPQTSPLDWIRAYDQPGIGRILKRRLAWACESLPEHMGSVLEIGFGSGVFQYELSRRAALSVAIDVHGMAAEVRERLAADGVDANLLRADGARLPFRAGSFDAVLILSALEFCDDPRQCLAESRRVLRHGGRIICVMPREGVWDAAFRLLSGQDPEKQFRGGRERARRAIEDELRGARRSGRPRPLPRFAAPYEIIVFDEPGESAAPLRSAALSRTPLAPGP